MKKLILILFLCPFFSVAQNIDTLKLYYSKEYGRSHDRLQVRKAILFPRDTILNKLGVAVIGMTMYVGNGVYWSAVQGGGGMATLTGDVMASGVGVVPVTLATVNANVGLFGSSFYIPSITVNAKGLVTAINTVGLPLGAASGIARLDSSKKLITTELRGVDLKRKNTIYSMGNSLTANGVYGRVLNVRLGSNWNVVNKGISGNTTLQMLQRFQTDILDAKDLDYIIVLGGINDINTGSFAAAIETNLQAMYTSAKNAGAKVVAITTLPFKNFATYTAAKQATQDSVNLWILNAAINVDYKLNAYPVIQNPSLVNTILPAYNSGDNLHLNEMGYSVLGDFIYSNVTWSVPDSATHLLLSGDTIIINQSLTNFDSPAFLDLKTNRQLLAANGTELKPSMSFSNNPNTGFYSFDANRIGIANNGAFTNLIGSTGNFSIKNIYNGQALNVGGNIFTIGGNNWVQDGYGFTNTSALTGMFPYANSIKFRNVGTDVFTVSQSNNVLFGTSTDNGLGDKVQVTGDQQNYGRVKIGDQSKLISSIGLRLGVDAANIEMTGSLFGLGYGHSLAETDSGFIIKGRANSSTWTNFLYMDFWGNAKFSGEVKVADAIQLRSAVNLGQLNTLFPTLGDTRYIKSADETRYIKTTGGVSGSMFGFKYSTSPEITFFQTGSFWGTYNVTTSRNQIVFDNVTDAASIATNLSVAGDITGGTGKFVGQVTVPAATVSTSAISRGQLTGIYPSISPFNSNTIRFNNLDRLDSVTISPTYTFARRSISAATTLSADPAVDHTIICTAGPYTVTLPSAAAGVFYIIKNMAAGIITVSATSIDGGATFSLSAIYKFVQVESTGGGNYIVTGLN